MSNAMKQAASVRAERKKDKLAERYRPIGISAVSAAAEYPHKPMKDKEPAASPARGKRARKRNADS
jgi:hypothetical protein